LDFAIPEKLSVDCFSFFNFLVGGGTVDILHSFKVLNTRAKRTNQADDEEFGNNDVTSAMFSSDLPDYRTGPKKLEI
jgi:hypothetical protein